MLNIDEVYKPAITIVYGSYTVMYMYLFEIHSPDFKDLKKRLDRVNTV